ncbi:AAA family ATPase [Endozoicomonas atrinae]|uniref:AAA family ATPase n=1 Tax=Endozoicomonas atrinae TaxID=1333660 RepID=UPI003AFFCE8A
MIENSVSSQNKRTSDNFAFFLKPTLEPRALNRTISLPELAHQTEPFSSSFGVDRTSSKAHHNFPLVAQRQVVYVDAGTQYQESDITDDRKLSSSNRMDAYYKLNEATKELKEHVGKGIGEKFMDTLTKELSFIVLSRGSKTTNQGILLHGAPGDGKTFLMEKFAAALSRCVDCKVINVKGVSFLGKNEEETTANFHKIISGNDPAHESEGSTTDASGLLRVLCIDELDASIIETPGRLNDQVRIVTNLFKSSLSGSSDDRVDDLYIIATTNAQIKNIPGALLRPGRIGKKLFIPKPTLAENRIFIERFCQEYKINTDSFNPEKVAILSHQKKQSVAQIKDMVLRAHQLAEIEGMERATNDAVQNMVSTEHEERTEAVDAKTTNQVIRDDLATLRFEHFYEVLHPKEELSNRFRTAMEGFSSEYSREFYYDLDHSNQLPEALRIIRSVSNGHNKSGIIFVSGEPGSGRTAFCTEMMKLSSPDIFRSTATPKQLKKIEPKLLELENEFCGRFDGFFPSNHNNRSHAIDENVHNLYNMTNAQSCFCSIVLIDDGDALMKPFDPSPVRGHRNQNASFEPANPAFYLEKWHQFIDNPENRNMVLVISSTKSAGDIKDYSGIKGMTLAEFRLPPSIGEGDMDKLMVHFGLNEEERLKAGKLLSNRTISIKQFVDYMDKTVTDGQFDLAELERLVKLNYRQKHNSMYI